MLQTKVNISHPLFKLSNKSSLLTIGSCFANTIGEKLLRYKFDAVVNPFGIIFNPLSIFNLLDFALKDTFPFQDDSLYGRKDDICFHHLVHSDLSALSKELLDRNIEKSLTRTKEQFEKAETIILTFGTAIVYELMSSKQTVANCHKVPSNYFSKRFLSTKEIIDSFEKLAPYLKDKKIVLTVSPVRHAKEGLVENSTSKSILKYACHILQQQHQNIYYFPAYEILLDELRDYRFYADDMLHPSSLAQDIIWQRFRETIIEEKSNKEIDQLEKLLKAFEHRSFFETSTANKKFIKETITKFKQFSGKADLAAEIEILEQRLNKIS